MGGSEKCALDLVRVPIWHARGGRAVNTKD
jgi:hypothetical protein